MKEQDFNIWEGVYESWDQAPVDDGVFAGDIWLNKISSAAQKNLESYQTPASISPVSATRDYILPVVASMIERRAGEVIRILDFGGGLAASYFPLVTAFSEPDSLEFHIIEGEAVCSRGKEMFYNQSNIHFHNRLPELKDPVHIVHSGSALQYVEDWQGLIVSLAEYKPKYFILADLLAGDIRTFVTIQNFYQKKIRSRFLNIKELLSVVEAVGFSLVYKSNYMAEIRGSTGPLPMENLERECQLDYACQVLFKRK